MTAEGAITGTFLVTEADAESAVLREVHEGRIHTLAENPGLEAGQVLEATIAPEPPLEVAWTVADLAAARTIPVEAHPEPPTRASMAAAEGQAVGELTRRERAGDGEIHVITVPEGETAAAVEDLVADETTVTTAARLGVARVEVRSSDGVVSVRYLPD